VLAISRPAASRPARQPTKAARQAKPRKPRKPSKPRKPGKQTRTTQRRGRTMLLLMPVPSSTELPGPEVSAVAEGLGEAAWRAILALIDGVREALFNRPGWCGALRPGENTTPISSLALRRPPPGGMDQREDPQGLACDLSAGRQGDGRYGYARRLFASLQHRATSPQAEIALFYFPPTS
jgi:hypothetical protein